MAEQSESIKKAVVTLRELSEDEKIRLQCEARERYQMDWQSSMRTSRERGKLEGIASGELKKAQEMAAVLAEKGMSVDEIAQIVGMEAMDVQKWLSFGNEQPKGTEL